MKKEQSRIVILAFCLCLLGLRDLYGQSSNCDEKHLPAEARNLLNDKFPGSHIVTMNDLDGDEKKAWVARNANECPGIVHGAFGPSTQGYAVLLTRKTGEFQAIETLVFLQQHSGKHSVHVLSPSSNVTAHTSVLSIGPPGKYYPVESGRAVKTQWPMVIYEAIGAGTTGYLYSGKKWHSIALSE